jgi:hypothetical protein
MIARKPQKQMGMKERQVVDHRSPGRGCGNYANTPS